MGLTQQLAQTSHDGDSQFEVQDPEDKGDIEIPGPQRAIVKKAQSLCEDSTLFEDPFPNSHQEVITRVDAWKSAARLCDLKGEIPNMEDKWFKYVSNLAWLYICPNLT